MTDHAIDYGHHHDHQAGSHQPPNDISAEQATLGGILTALSQRDAHELLAEVLEIAPAEKFYRPAHQVILSAMTELADQGAPLDAIAVNKHLLARGQTAVTGGAPYLHTLTEAIPNTANTTYYAKAVADVAVLRRLVEVAARIDQLGRTGEGEVAELVEIARAEVDTITTDGSTDDPDTVLLADDYPDFLDEMERGLDQGEGVELPYADLQDRIGDMMPGQLITVGGRPGQGKTAIGLDMARHAARNGHKVLFHSLEMTRREVQTRILAAEQRIPLEKLVPGRVHDLLSEAEERRYLEHAQTIGDLQIVVDDRSGASLSRIKAQIGRLERSGGAPSLVVVDYLQLMDKPDGDREDLRIKEVTTALKRLAKEKNLIIVLLSQVRRESVNREDGVPLLSDFADSAAVERDSNICLMLSTPGKDDPDHPRSGEAILNVAKNRGGKTGRVDLSAQLHLAQFANLA